MLAAQKTAGNLSWYFSLLATWSAPSLPWEPTANPNAEDTGPEEGDRIPLHKEEESTLWFPPENPKQGWCPWRFLFDQTTPANSMAVVFVNPKGVSYRNKLLQSPVQPKKNVFTQSIPIGLNQIYLGPSLDFILAEDTGLEEITKNAVAAIEDYASFLTRSNMK